MNLLRPFDDFAGGDDVGQPPAGDRVGLGQGGAGQRPLPHSGQGGKIGVTVGGVDDVLVDLIGNNIGIIFPGKRGDDFQLFPGKDLAAGVGRVAQHQRLGFLAEGILQHRRVKMEIRRYKRYINRLGAGQDGVRAVVFIEGGKDNHLVSRIGDGHHCRHHGLGAAAGDNNLAVGIDGPPHIAGLFGCQRLPEILRAPGVMFGPSEYEPMGNYIKFASDVRNELASRNVPDWFEKGKTPAGSDTGQYGEEASVEGPGKDRYMYKLIKNIKNKNGIG